MKAGMEADDLMYSRNARSRRAISPHPEEKTSGLGGSICSLV
jgi:hypothetical protein